MSSGEQKGGVILSLSVDAVLFDNDGVLVDSLDAVDRTWRRWAERVGLDPEFVVAEVHGFRAIESIRRLVPDRDAEAEDRWVEDLEVAESEDVTALPGSLEVFGSVPADRRAIATSATMRLARARLESAGFDVPDALVTADMVAAGKPAPDPYLQAARHLGVEPARCVVFDDTPAGVRAGAAAGATVVGVRTGDDHATLAAAGASATVADLRAVTVSVDHTGLTLTIGA